MVKLANFKEDSKQRNLLVYDYGISGKNGSRKLEIQVDSRDAVAKNGAGLTPDKAASLRLVDRQTHYKDANGNVQSRFEHGAFYTGNQFDKIKEAAGDKAIDITLANGNTVGVYGIKADLIQTQETFRDKDLNTFKGRVLAIDTSKEMGPSDFCVGPKVYENQFKRGQAIKEAVAAAYEAQPKETPEVPAVEAESKGVEMDAPEM
jgi:hypothetical protein